MSAHTAAIVPDYQKAEADAISLDQRCEIIVGLKRGTVKYKGKIAALGPGYWVGV